MPTFLYKCVFHGEFEISHSIKEQLEECPQCKEDNIKSDPPQKLISKSSFILKGGGWGIDSYSKK